MLLGMFGGTSLVSLQKQQTRIQQLQDSFLNNKDRAVADTMAGIKELQDRLYAIQRLK